MPSDAKVGYDQCFGSWVFEEAVSAVSKNVICG